MIAVAVGIGGSAKAEPQILHTGPVAGIVTAFITFLRIIGNFITLITVRCHHLPGQMVHLPVRILIRKIRQRHDCRAGCYFCCRLCSTGAASLRLAEALIKQGPLFNDKAVSGNMFRSQHHDLF